MADLYSSARIHSPTMTLDYLEAVAADMLEEMYEAEAGDTAHDAAERYLFLQGRHGSLVHEQLPPFLERIMASDPSVTRIELREEDADSNYSEVISGRVLLRDQPWREYTSALVPDNLGELIANVRRAMPLDVGIPFVTHVNALIEGIESGGSL